MDDITGLETRKDIHFLFQKHLKAFPCIVFDIDSFQGINHCFGHLEADSILQKLGAFFIGIKQEHSTQVYRWGGDEFLLLLPDRTLSDAEEISRFIVKKIQELRLPYAHPLNDRTVLTVSCVVFIPNVDTREFFEKEVESAILLLEEKKNSDITEHVSFEKRYLQHEVVVIKTSKATLSS